MELRIGNRTTLFAHARLAESAVCFETEALVELLAGWCRRYPIVSIEDPVAEGAS